MEYVIAFLLLIIAVMMVFKRPLTLTSLLIRSSNSRSATVSEEQKEEYDNKKMMTEVAKVIVYAGRIRMTIPELKEKYDLAYSHAPNTGSSGCWMLPIEGIGVLAAAPTLSDSARHQLYQLHQDQLVAPSIRLVSPQLQPTSEKDQELVEHLNIASNRFNVRVGYYQFLAGERAALTNLGLTQVGWDDTLSGGSGDSFYRGNITLKNVDPLKFMRDPFAPSLETAGWCVYYDNYHKSVFLENPKYREAFKKFYEKKKGDTPNNIPMHSHEKPAASAKDYFTLYIYWVNEDGIIKEYHVINNEEMLWERGKILPNEYPFAELYATCRREPLSVLQNVARHSPTTWPTSDGLH